MQVCHSYALQATGPAAKWPSSCPKWRYPSSADTLEDLSLSPLNSPEASRKILMSVSYHYLQKTNTQVSSPSSLALTGCVGLCRPNSSSQHWPVLVRWLLFQRSCFIWSLSQPTEVAMTVLPIQQPRKPKPMASWANCEPDRPLDYKVQALGHEAIVPSSWQLLALSPGLL